jgi:hypothetical protein
MIEIMVTRLVVKPSVQSGGGVVGGVKGGYVNWAKES